MHARMRKDHFFRNTLSYAKAAEHRHPETSLNSFDFFSMEVHLMSRGHISLKARRQRCTLHAVCYDVSQACDLSFFFNYDILLSQASLKNSLVSLWCVACVFFSSLFLSRIEPSAL